MVEETAWLPFAVGQVAALAVGALSVMIMPTERPSAAMAPVSARVRARGRAAEVMSRFLLLVCLSVWLGSAVRVVAVVPAVAGRGQSFPAPAPLVTEATTVEAGSAV